MSSPLIRVGISSCLLGETVRHDGNHKYNHDLVTSLGQYFQWVAICPEVEMGLGVPRETMGLVQKGNNDIRLITHRSGTDYTSSFQSYAKGRVASLVKENIYGFIFKSGSPSCGLKDVPLLNSIGVQAGTGQGLFVSILLSYLPSLPVEEAEQLADPHQRENFTTRVLAYHNSIG